MFTKTEEFFSHLKNSVHFEKKHLIVKTKQKTQVKKKKEIDGHDTPVCCDIL